MFKGKKVMKIYLVKAEWSSLKPMTIYKSLLLNNILFKHSDGECLFKEI